MNHEFTKANENVPQVQKIRGSFQEGLPMKLPEDGVLLRIFIGESDKYQGKPLYEQIVLKAKELNLAGATVTRGIMGFGANSRVHTAKLLRLSEDLPLVVEIVDSEEYIAQILPFLDEVVQEGLITMEKVRVLKYGYRPRSGSNEP